MVSLTVPGEKPGQQQTVQLPLFNGRTLDAAALRQPSFMPASIVQQLQQMGHQVQQRRELVPVQLQDGRDGFLPVDQIDVQFVGNKFQ